MAGLTTGEKAKRLIDSIKAQGIFTISISELNQAISRGLGIHGERAKQYVKTMKTIGLIYEGGRGWVLK